MPHQVICQHCTRRGDSDHKVCYILRTREENSFTGPYNNRVYVGRYQSLKPWWNQGTSDGNRYLACKNCIKNVPESHRSLFTYDPDYVQYGKGEVIEGALRESCSVQ